MQKARRMIVAFGLLLACYSLDYERIAHASFAATPGVNKRALLVGINRYRYPNAVPSLAGSVNDVEDMKALLIGKFNFSPENILVLTDEKATHAGIIAAFENHLINKSQPGD